MCSWVTGREGGKDVGREGGRESRVDYSIQYFYRVTAFKVLYLRTSVKGGAQTRCVNAATIDICNYALRMSPALNRSSEIQHFLML